MIVHDIAVIGAGPVGLAAAAQAVSRGLRPVLFEKGPEVGHAVSQWRHVPMFSNWGYSIDAAARSLLEAEGWQAPDAMGHPTGADLISDYLEPLSRVPAIGAALRLGTEVTGISRSGLGKVHTAEREARPFVLRTRSGDTAEAYLARSVIDASGTWSEPAPAGVDGYPVPGEAEHRDRIDYAMPDVTAGGFAGRSVAVIGGGHSAIGTLIALADLPGTTPIWLYRGERLSKAYGGGDADRLAARGALGTGMAGLVRSGRVHVETGFATAAFSASGSGLFVEAEDGRRIEVARAVVATGFRPRLDMLREVRIALDPALECPPALAPLIDPNVHSCGTVRPHGAAELRHPEPGFYIAGMKSYGRAPTFLMATGHEQVRSIVAEIAGDAAAARRFELHLPATGVCSGPGPQTAGQPPVEGGCCGPTRETRTRVACC